MRLRSSFLVWLVVLLLQYDGFVFNRIAYFSYTFFVTTSFVKAMMLKTTNNMSKLRINRGSDVQQLKNKMKL